MMEQLYSYRDYLLLRGYKDSTIRHNLSVAREYLTYIRRHPPQGFIAYIQNRSSYADTKARLSESTLNTYYTSLKVYFAYRRQVAGETPPLHIPAIRKHGPQIEILTIAEIKKLFACCKDLRDKAVLALLYHAGLRIGEAVRVDTGDIDFGKGLLFVSRSKTGRQRQVPLNATALDILQAYIDKERPINNRHRLLQGLQGDMTNAGIEGVLKRTKIRTGITKRVYPHLLRHSIASHLLERGMPLEQVSLFLGHSNAESTRRYTHLLPP